ncbi:MAG: Eco57I restriction-modification methylase domain-containing protein [Anaerolineales bacterium]|nr:Eco57I restriction-modification methylase domain-containing protein [Anaerolineales bacterium]
MPESFRQTTLNLLKALPDRKQDALKQLFWSELNYNRSNTSLPVRDWPQSLSAQLVSPPLLFAAAGDADGFHVIYCQLKANQLLLGLERQIVTRLLPEHPFSLFIFSDQSAQHWHFVNVKYERDGGQRSRRVFRRITIGPEERLRTAAERVALLDTATISRDLFGIPPLVVQQRHDEAFNVEAVTEKFFEEYKKIFEAFRKYLQAQSQDPQWAHEYALQFLNRLMFLYYVQRKRWLGQDPDFIASYWQAYLNSNQPVDTFVSHWLNVLFFEAFNNQFQAGRSDRLYLPENLRVALAMAPYLNGGLFSQNKLDTSYTVAVNDSQYEIIHKFLENYNFTISEDTPLDQEVAVDPEMIGKVYESLVNVSEEADERGDAGIFYTPRVEIDLMCRLSLVDYLANHLGAEYKTLLYRLVFAFDETDKQQADQAISEQNLWPSLDQLLRSVAVLDPACGSGSFLVGMLYVLNDLRQRASAQLGDQDTAYERKKDIIRASLYGVDAMRWAVHIAELRLWLQLVIDTDMEPAELKFRPLLPNLSFKLRHGDSLVQEVAGINLAARHGGVISQGLKGKITALKGEKLKYYNNDPERSYQSEEQLRHAELVLFREILSARMKYLEGRLQELEIASRPQTNLFGEVTAPQLALSQAAAKQEEEKVRLDLDAVRRAFSALINPPDVPFVWDIAFVEMSEDDKVGFDIVIGNPPYVRQEKIHDPLLPFDESGLVEAKKEYKAKLARSVYAYWQLSFGYNQDKGQARWKLDAKSDLYIYFYFHGLHLLKPQGAFCFITSNSWLDVGYGRDLQEFLLTRGQVKFIIDNQSRRSFARADVNTIIVLLGPAVDQKRERRQSLEHVARFVMLTVPFEQTLSPVIWEELEDAQFRTKTPEYRLQIFTQNDLYISGLDVDKKYSGDKWGGKYLRAPEIFFILMSKGKQFEDVLSNYFIGERYLNTGGADGFFILTNVSQKEEGVSFIINSGNPPFEGELETKFLQPLVKDYTKSNRRILIDGYDAYCLVIRDTPTPRLRDYILWGESQGYHLRSVTRNQHPWYKPTNQMLTAATILVPRSFNDTFVIHYNPHKFLSLRFYRLHLKKGGETPILGYLNSTLIALILETLGNKSLGQGVLDFFMADFLSLKLPVIANDELAQAFDVISNRLIGNIWNEYGITPSDYSLINPKPDRLHLDQIIFDVLQLTQTERDGVYEELAKMVEARLSKASSLKDLQRLEW